MSTFSLLIKPSSADCNIACEYCFYTKKSSLYPDTKIHRMNHKTLATMISSFMKEDMKSYIFSWQGGEPTLLGVDFFKDIVKLQRHYGRRGAIVANTLQTNAILIDNEFANHLARYKFLTGISIDGPAAIHNYYRKNKGGQNTHSKVMKGIKTLRNAGVDCNYLTVINDRSMTKAKDVFNFFMEQKFYYQQYIPCVEFINENELTPFSVTPQAWGNFLCELFDLWYAQARNRCSIRLFDTILQYYIDGTRNSCTIGTECNKYLVVEYNGDIYPCDFYVQKQYRLGNITADTWNVLKNKGAYLNFSAAKANFPNQCNRCEFVDLCQGDCPKHRLNATAGGASYLCEGWKIFFNHALEKLKNLATTMKQLSSTNNHSIK